MKIRVLTLNAHKGFTSFNQKFVLAELREAIRSTQADLVFLQEVQGSQSKHPKLNHISAFESQVEFLADTIWSEHAYGKNAVYQNGDHGNAILSKYPIIRSENIDLSLNPFEKRGLLFCEVRLNENFKLNCFTVHLNLLSRDRKKQWDHISKEIHKQCGREQATLVAGDFNDWTKKLHSKVKEEEFEEAFESCRRQLARTWPAQFPVLSLDRIYSRNLRSENCEVLQGAPWNRLSDHLPLLGDFHLSRD